MHRDIKPDNVFLNEHGRPIIGDFGLAESVAPTGATFDPNERHILLVDLTGTPQYMSPEQWTGQGYSFPSDLFSWAVLIFEMLIGRVSSCCVLRSSWLMYRVQPLWRRLDSDDTLAMAKRTVLGSVPQWLGSHTLPNEETYNLLQGVSNILNAHSVALTYLRIQILQNDAAHRPTIDQIIAHPFFADT